MAKKYLAAIDNPDTAIRIAEYLKDILKKDDNVTIFNVIVNPLLMFGSNPEGVPVYINYKEILDNLDNVKKTEIQNSMEKVIGILKPFVKEKNIYQKIESQGGSVAHCIVDEAEKNGYDSIIIGKHNSVITELLIGSVTHKVIHLSKGIPVIVV